MSWWNRVRNRHNDGTKHRWRAMSRRVGEHYCGYDYCHCYWAQCTVCLEEELVSDGADEMR